jgi:hypothetical protein
LNKCNNFTFFIIIGNYFPARPAVCTLDLFHCIATGVIVITGCTVGMDRMVRLLAHRAVDAAGLAVEIGRRESE